MSTAVAVDRPTAGSGDGLAVLLLTALVVVATPVVLVPALVVRSLLGRRWPDRLVAALLAVVGAAGFALIVLGGFLGAWLTAARWVVSTVTPWLQGSPRPASSDLLLLAGAGLVLGTTYGALRWVTAQAKAEADLYDGKDERERRMRAEERRRRKVAQCVQQMARGSRSPVVRAAAAPLAVPLGDARGPFVGRYQHGTLGGKRIEVRRRSEDRLWRSGQSVRVPLGSGSPVQHLVVLGATGTGKTESTLRLCEWALTRRWQVIYVSAKEPPSREEAAAPRLTPLAQSLARDSRVLVPDSSPFRRDAGEPGRRTRSPVGDGAVV